MSATQTDTLIQELNKLQIDMRWADALYRRFSTEPGYTVDGFMDGLNWIARCLAEDDLVKSRASYPEPWETYRVAMTTQPTIHDGMELAGSVWVQDLDVWGAIIHSIAAAARKVNIALWKTKNPTTTGKLTSSDYMAALDGLGYHFRLNVLDDVVECSDGGGRWEPLSDVKEAVIRSRMRDEGFTKVDHFRDAFIADAAKNAYHPVKAYLEACSQKALESHFLTGSVNPVANTAIENVASCFTDTHNIFATLLYRWAIGVCARVYHAEQLPVLVLEGAQGIGKSHFVQWLGSSMPDYCYEGLIDPSNKDDLRRLMNTFLWEVSELGSTTRRADREQLKYFLTMRQVTVRIPYGHNDLHKPALAAFIATANNENGLLSDGTGSRRFWTCHITAIDWNYTKTDPDMFWAQAMALYQAGESWKLTPAEQQQVNQVNDSYEIEDPTEDLIATRYEIDTQKLSGRFTPTNDIREILHTTGWRIQNHTAESRAIVAAAQRLGARYGRGPDPLTGVRVRGFYGMQMRVP